MTDKNSSEAEKPNESSEPTAKKPYFFSRLHQKCAAFARTKKGKIVLSAVGVLALLGVLLAIPTTRYQLLGLFIKYDFSVIVTDSVTAKPVSDAQVTIGNYSSSTNGDGKAEFKRVPTGRYTMSVNKRYYNAASQTITLGLKNPKEFDIDLQAAGRQVPLKVIDKISKKPLTDAHIAILDTKVTTDEKGEATAVVPADPATQKATVTKDGFNNLETEIQVIEQPDDRNTLALTPAGTITYLSKQTGHIDVMKSNLDGSDAKVILAGTGLENDTNTVLLATRDWRYAALHAQREGDKAKLYLINVETGTNSVIDEGDAYFTPVGWYNDNFIYTVDRSNVKIFEPKKYALKSFNASTNKLTTLDETEADGGAFENIQAEYILDNLVVYQKVWYGNGASNGLSGKQSAIRSVKPDGQDKKILKEFPVDTYGNINARLYKPQEIYYRANHNDGVTVDFYEYENGQVEPTTDIDANNFSIFTVYPTYLLSPSGQKTLWSESRNGHNIVFTGDQNADQAKEVNTTDNLTAYGWYTDDYLFASKNGSELYILPFDNTQKVAPLKVTDYHKPAVDFSGYGYGYGGF